MPTERNARESSAERASPAADDRAITVETPFVPVGELPSGIVAAVSSLRFAWFSITEWLLFAWLWIVLALSFVFVGLLLMPRTLDLAERAARRQRAWAYRLPGVPVVATYRPLPADVDPADWRSTMQRLRDPTVRRDLIWALVNPTVGLVLSLLPAWLMYHGIRGLVEVAIVLTTGLVSPLGTWFGMPIDHSTWWIVGLVAPVEAVVGYVVARPLLRLHGRWVRLVLGGDAPSELQAALQAALTHVRQTRRTALELQEAEIARIQRDLHDGAQARLVAMGMTLSQVSELVRENPDAAIASIERAKGDASAALDELRGLVRGIRPPVLADRGLVEAVRALAAETLVPTQVVSDLSRPLASPLEAALYFAVAELVTNAVKHADATRITIEFVNAGSDVGVMVDDDGRGGIDPSATADGSRTGLDGIHRRLATLDGRMHESSPVGGPTRVRLTVPALSR